MKTRITFACLLAAFALFVVEDRQAMAQASPPVAIAHHATLPATAPAKASKLAIPLPMAYGNPFVMPGTAGGATKGVNSKIAAPVSADACSVDPGGASATGDPDPLGLAPGGAADALSTTQPSPRAVNPAIKACESGRIIVRVQNKRFYAYHVGDEIPISVQILVDDGVQLDFTSLKQQVLGFGGSDFQLIPVRVVSIASRPYEHRPHSTLYGLELAVQTFVTKPSLVFNLDLKYAIDVPPGVKQPNWRILTTPDFVVTNTPVVTMSTDDELDEGDLQPADLRSSWVQWPLLVAGACLIVWFGFARGLVIRWNKARPGRVLTAEERAWNVFTKVFSDAEDYGEFSPQFLRNVDLALRIYLAHSTGMRIESLSIKEISALMEDDARLATIVSALNKCESVIYARSDQPVKLSAAQIDELYQELTLLVPAPEE